MKEYFVKNKDISFYNLMVVHDYNFIKYLSKIKTYLDLLQMERN